MTTCITVLVRCACGGGLTGRSAELDDKCIIEVKPCERCLSEARRAGLNDRTPVPADPHPNGPNTPYKAGPDAPGPMYDKEVVA